MFKVDRPFMSPLSAFFNNEDTKVYTCVELTMNVFVFLFEYTVMADGEDLATRRILFHDTNDVLTAAANFKDHTLYLLAPGSAEKNTGISLNIVIEIAKVGFSEHLTFLYKCNNGASYLNSFLLKDEPDFKYYDMIYSKPTSHEPSKDAV